MSQCKSKTKHIWIVQKYSSNTECSRGFSLLTKFRFIGETVYVARRCNLHTDCITYLGRLHQIRPPLKCNRSDLGDAVGRKTPAPPGPQTDRRFESALLELPVHNPTHPYTKHFLGLYGYMRPGGHV